MDYQLNMTRDEVEFLIDLLSWRLGDKIELEDDQDVDTLKSLIMSVQSIMTQ